MHLLYLLYAFTHLQLILPQPSNVPRTSQVAASTTLFSGYEEVTIFGGCVGPAFGVSIHEIPKLANTTVITFGKHSFDHKFPHAHAQGVK